MHGLAASQAITSNSRGMTVYGLIACLPCGAAPLLLAAHSGQLDAAGANAQEGEQQAMPSNLRKARLPSLSLVPVITRDIKVDPSGCYEALPHFSHFGDQIRFVGGVNRPKLIQARRKGHMHAAQSA